MSGRRKLNLQASRGWELKRSALWNLRTAQEVEPPEGQHCTLSWTCLCRIGFRLATREVSCLWSSGHVNRATQVTQGSTNSVCVPLGGLLKPKSSQGRAGPEVVPGFCYIKCLGPRDTKQANRKPTQLASLTQSQDLFCNKSLTQATAISPQKRQTQTLFNQVLRGERFHLEYTAVCLVIDP